jgi:hypothetical protein
MPSSSLYDPTDTETLKQAFVRTYDPPGYDDAWDAIEDYERVQAVAADNPEKGSQAISTIVELPRGRMKRWLADDGMPDAYRGLQTLERRDWLPDAWDDDTMVGLAGLAAGIYAGGSIATETYTPRFTASEESEQCLIAGVASALDCQLRRVADVPPEYEPQQDGAVLGRLLVALGCPAGHKNAQSVRTLPLWEAPAPHAVRLPFAQVYVALRGHDRSDRPGLQIAETRRESYRQSLEALFRDVTDDPDGVSTGSWPIYISGDAYETLTAPVAIVRRCEQSAT